MDEATEKKIVRAARAAAKAASRGPAALDVESENYPWRKNPGPYEVFVAEFLLRKTTYKQAAPVFSWLVASYPDPCSLAAADESALAERLKSLGLYGRANLMLAAAREVCKKYGGRIPCSRELLEALPGAGPYLAGAVLSFGCREQAAIVDTGIARMWGRIIPGAVKRLYSPHRDPGAWLASRTYIEHFRGNPDTGNYILLDTARLVCLPKKPLCEQCPFKKTCETWRKTLG